MDSDDADKAPMFSPEREAMRTPRKTPRSQRMRTPRSRPGVLSSSLRTPENSTIDDLSPLRDAGGGHRTPRARLAKSAHSSDDDSCLESTPTKRRQPKGLKRKNPPSDSEPGRRNVENPGDTASGGETTSISQQSSTGMASSSGLDSSAEGITSASQSSGVQSNASNTSGRMTSTWGSRRAKFQAAQDRGEIRKFEHDHFYCACKPDKRLTLGETAYNVFRLDQHLSKKVHYSHFVVDGNNKPLVHQIYGKVCLSVSSIENRLWSQRVALKLATFIDHEHAGVDSHPSAGLYWSHE
jgi:hypothetical protein